MIVDCMTCPVRGQRCDDCAVTVLRTTAPADHLVAPGHLTSPPAHSSSELQLDVAERRVVSMLVGAGLVNAGAAATLSARRESLQPWGAMSDVG